MSARKKPILMPWQDRSGAFSWLKAAAFAVALAPGAWLLYRTFGHTLGSRPIIGALHLTGTWTVRLLILTLAITPARRIFQWPRLILIRRMLGVATMAYALLHFSLYAFDQDFNFLHVASEIALRFYLTIGFAALVLLVALGATSTDGMIRRLGGKRWQRLHYAVYPIGLLALTHFLLQAKLDTFQVMLMVGAYFWLMAYRLVTARLGAPGPAMLFVLAVANGLALALFEAAWYGLTTGIPASKVLAADWSIHAASRPCWWVLSGGLAVALAGLARAHIARRANARAGGAPAQRPAVAFGPVRD